MREIHTYVLDYPEPAAVWCASHDATLRVSAGEAWLTVDGRRDDYWLGASEAFELPRGACVRIGAGRGGARIEVMRTVAVLEPPFWRDAAARVRARWSVRRRRAQAVWSTPT